MKTIFNLVKKKNLQYLFLFAAVFGFIWLGKVFINIKLGLAVQEITLDFHMNGEGKDEQFEKIAAFRLSPSNNRGSLVKDSHFKAFYSESRGYFKRIELEFPLEVKESIKGITLWIGKISYTYSRDELFTGWKQTQNGGLVILSSPRDLGRRSKLPPLRSIMNWKGDGGVFVASFFFTFFQVCIPFLAAFLLLHMVKKKTPPVLSPGLYEHYVSKTDNLHKPVFASVYKKRGQDYTFSEDEKDSGHVPFLIDRLENNSAGKLTAALFCLIIFIAFVQRMITIQLPIFTADSWGYVGNAISNYGSGGFIHSPSRTFVYPYFLQVILNIFHDFSAIAVVQHLLGIITGIFIYLIWLELGRMLVLKIKDKLLYNCAGLIPLFVYITSDSAVVIEKYIMRESIYPFFLVMMAFFVIRLIRALKEKRENQVYLFTNLSMFTNYLIFVFQSRWGGTLLFNGALYALMLFFIFKGRILPKGRIVKKAALLVLLPFVLMFVFIYTPENFIKTGGNTAGSFLSPHLLFSHANIVSLDLEKDINDPDFDKFDKKVLIGLKGHIEDVMANGDHSGFPTLGFNPDLFTYGPGKSFLLNNLDDETYIYFCRYYFIKTITKHPFLYLKKVLGQLGIFYNLKGGMYPDRMQSSDIHQWRGTYKFLTLDKTACFPYNKFYSRVKGIVERTGDTKKITFAVDFLMLFALGIVYVPVLLLFCALLTFIITKRKNSSYTKLIIPGLFILYLFLCNFCISFSNASIFILENRRYLEDQYLLVLLSQSLAITFCVIAAGTYIKESLFSLQGKRSKS